MLDLCAILAEPNGDFRELCMQMSPKTVLAESELIEICRHTVPPAAAVCARLSLLDWMGCVIAARHTPVAQKMAQALARNGSAMGNDLLQIGVALCPSDAQTAALALGTLGNVLEIDDLHRASILHPGDTTCAAALAVALQQQTSGEALLHAIARGYEAAVRIGTAVAAGGYTPFYNSGTCGVFGAAVAAADLKGLDATGMADALGQAGMQAAGIWQCRLEPTFSKQLGCAHAARAGVLSAELAAVGFTGARAILTGDLGFFASYYPTADQTALTAPGDWAITQMSFKPFAACRHTHPAISAALDLRKDLAHDALARVDVYTYRAALDFCDAPAPTTSQDARFSLQHAVATTLLNGAPAISAFEGSALTDPATSSLRARVHLHCDATYSNAFPKAYGARVRITLKDGQTRDATCPSAWGDPENRMSTDDLTAKFHANAAYGGIDRTQSDAIMHAVMGLTGANDLSVLKTALETALTLKLEFA